MTKDDILRQIVNRAKELNPYSQFDYYYENEDDTHISYTKGASKQEKQAIKDVIYEYMRDIFEIDSGLELPKVKIIGNLIINKKSIGISIQYLLKDDNLLIPWNENKVFEGDMLTSVFNGYPPEAMTDVISGLNTDDYVITTLIPQYNPFELFRRKKMFSFDWTDFRKILRPEGDEYQYVCNIVRSLKVLDGNNPLKHDFILPMGPNLIKLLDDEVKNKSGELDVLLTEFDKRKDECDKAENALAAKREEITNICQQLTKNEELKKQLDIDVLELQSKQASLDAQITEKELRLIEKQRKYNDISAVIEKARAYGYLANKEDVDYTEKSQIFSSDFNDAVRQIRCALKQNTGWTYSDFIVRSMLLGVLSKQLIILCGEPGSGKTSFAEEFSKVVGYEECVIVPVQSSWMDSSDLLGYYNPLNGGGYVPTFFLESLNRLNKMASAEGNTDKLFFICLDEMNLSHVEYYFADFLSVLQFDDPVKRTIRLYNGDGQDRISDIPPRISIANNIRFIGTINIDETTKSLSPKVIDRAFFVRMENDVTNSDEIELQNEPGYSNYYLSLVNWDEGESYLDVKEFKAAVNSVLSHKLSHRFDRTLDNIMPYVLDFTSDVREAICASLVLPRINDEFDDASTLMNIIKNYGSDRLVSFIREKMCIKDDDLISYWRR